MCVLVDGTDDGVDPREEDRRDGDDKHDEEGPGDDCDDDPEGARLELFDEFRRELTLHGRHGVDEVRHVAVPEVFVVDLPRGAVLSQQWRVI